MIKRLVTAIGWMTISAAPVAGAPDALNAGHWSLGFEIDRDVNIEVGYGLFDMTRLIVSAGFSSLGDDEIPSSRIEYETSYSAGVTLHRYINAASTSRFATFFGGGIEFTETGKRTQVRRFGDSLVGGSIETSVDLGDTLEFTGRFGAEAFPLEPVSVSGFVGISGTVHTDGGTTGGLTGSPQELEQGNDFSTFRSGLVVTYYWGGP